VSAVVGVVVLVGARLAIVLDTVWLPGDRRLRLR